MAGLKIRIRDNSIRLRLTRGEVEAVRRDGLVVSETGFADGGLFRYALESSPASVAPAARFADAEIRVRLPESAVASWAASDDEVSIRGEQALDSGGRTDDTRRERLCVPRTA